MNNVIYRVGFTINKDLHSSRVISTDNNSMVSEQSRAELNPTLLILPSSHLSE